jgi:Transcriptional regulator, AbiEi antitoxin, Type IV TA system
MPTFSIKVSSPERAMLECLYLSPDTVDLMECHQIMAGMTTLRPKLVQKLLEHCNSIKVKRLFLYLANRAGHDWLKRPTAAFRLKVHGQARYCCRLSIRTQNCSAENLASTAGTATSWDAFWRNAPRKIKR